MNLLDKIQKGLFRNPAAPAFIFRDRVITGAHFYAILCEVTKRLHDNGIRPGDVIGVSMEQSPLHCAVMLGLARLGAISLPLHPGTPPAGRANLAKKFSAKMIVASEKVSEVEDVKTLRLGGFNVEKGEQILDFIDYRPDADTPVRIALTSGTTGEPSGIMYTHGYWVDRIIKTVDDMDQNTRVIPADLHLTLGSLFAFGAIMAGGTVIFQRSPSLQDHIAAINLHAATHIIMPPASATAMLKNLPRTGISFPTVKQMRIVGGALPTKLMEAIRAHLTPNLYHSYGISEIGIITMATPEMLVKYPGSSGIMRPGAIVEVVDEKGELIATGDSGELRVKIPGMATDYYNDPEKTSVRFRDGWYYTGDIGHIDVDGLVYVIGREDDKVNVAGMKFNPQRIEEALEKHPGVDEAVIFPYELPHGETIVCAAIVAANKEVVGDLPQYCAGLRMGNMTPKSFFLTNELPRNPSGKVIRAEVPKLFKNSKAVTNVANKPAGTQE